MKRRVVTTIVVLIAVMIAAYAAGADRRRMRPFNTAVYKTYEIFYQDPTANFTYDPTTGEAPLEVEFTNTSGGYTSCLWNFDDGTTSTEVSPTHEFEDPDTYTVVLTVYNDYGQASHDVDIVVDSACTTPVAAFSATPLTGRAPKTVTFTNTSTGDPTPTYEWNFGDTGTSTSTSPTHEYTTGGLKTVTLTATNTCGNDVEEKEEYVNLLNPWAQMQTLVIGMSSGKMTAKSMTFPTSVSLTVRYWNNDTNTQIGTDKTGSGTTITVVGVNVSDDVNVGIQYKTSNAASGWANVTSWHEATTMIMVNGSGDSGTITATAVPD